MKEETEKGSGKCAKWPGRSYLQCLGPLGFPVGMPALVMALGVLLQCHSSWPDAAVYLHMAGSAVVPSPCRPLLLPSPLRPPGTRARAYPRLQYQISPGFGLAGLALQAELRGSPNRAFPKCTIHGTCINPIGAAPECILSKLGGCTPREVWFLNGW